MKWSKVYLDKLESSNFTYSEDIDFSSETFPKATDILALKNVHVEGRCNYNTFQESLSIDLTLTGIMVIPCARSLKPVDYEFNINQPVTYTFKPSDDEDFIEVINEIDTLDFIRETILLNKPTVVYSKDSKPIEYEEEESIDPRLAKLKEFFKEN